MRGKEKCRALKEIRRQIAEANDITLAISECTYQGECRGTCPKCESELRFLERELALRRSLGKAVAVVGLSAGVCASVTACSPGDFTGNPSLGAEELSGDIAEPYDEETQSVNSQDLSGFLTAPYEEEETQPETPDTTDTALPGEAWEEVEGELELTGDIAPYEPEDGAAACEPDGAPADE